MNEIDRRDLTTWSKRAILTTLYAVPAMYYLTEKVDSVYYVAYPVAALAVPHAGYMLYRRTGIAAPWTEGLMIAAGVGLSARFLSRESWSIAALASLVGMASYTLAVAVADAYWGEDLSL